MLAEWHELSPCGPASIPDNHAARIPDLMMNLSRILLMTMRIILDDDPDDMDVFPDIILVIQK